MKITGLQTDEKGIEIDLYGEKEEETSRSLLQDMRQLPSQREIHGQGARTAYLQVLPIPPSRGTGGYEAVQRGGTRRVQISHVTPGLGTAGTVRQKIQGYGVRQVRAGHAGYETGQL